MAELSGRSLAKSSRYLDWIRSQPCVVTGIVGEGVQAAHVRSGNDCGMGIKPSDYVTVPLNWYQHQEQHAYHGGERAWWRDVHDLDPDVVCSQLLVKYIVDSGGRVELQNVLEDLAKAYGEKKC